ncbi:tigger transposable element-derived protein 7-like [Nilaparvata lugens]|uniref:tigger transposable element-derived protein 7-like n=1 Tax=Nilaparvata lugens TaxID=108931 RepID=UPI00193CC984|nr:tigger transposable element-derived protein 7-like [Nilaparvata lugens]
MPQNYQRQVGARKYTDYSAETLQMCLNDIQNGLRSQRNAAEHYGIPRSTIKNKLKGNLREKVGRPTIFTEEEEKCFENHIHKLAEYGFPTNELDIRFTIKSYLDKQGRQVKQFSNNLPGKDWVISFRKRHPKLTVRKCSNIKRARAAVDESIINNYFNNLEVTLQNVPPENIWNYDETNLCNDPGSAKVVCKRGSKYVERIMDSTKSCISIMFCGNAVGEMLPPYVVFKSEHLWSTWTEGGPKDCRYNRSKNGWFDTACFEDWFTTCLLPRLQKESGTKVIIGDNLSSHISVQILKICEQNDIRFVCLPANSTHITQPLDVAYYGPMKQEWRKILTNWKEAQRGKNLSNLPKDEFSKLLKVLVDHLFVEKKQNMISGFLKTGIQPLDRKKALDRLPQRNVNVDLVSDSFIEKLVQRREKITSTGSSQPLKKKQKKLDVPPGKSIGVEDIELQLGPSTSNLTQPKNKRVRPKKDSKETVQQSDSSDCDDPYSIHDDSFSDDDLVWEELVGEDEQEEEEEDLRKSYAASKPTLDKDNLKEGNFVIVKYNEGFYPGMISKMPSEDKDGPTVHCMQKKKKSWGWPEKKTF